MWFSPLYDHASLTLLRQRFGLLQRLLDAHAHHMQVHTFEAHDKNAAGLRAHCDSRLVSASIPLVLMISARSAVQNQRVVLPRLCLKRLKVMRTLPSDFHAVRQCH